MSNLDSKKTTLSREEQDRLFGELRARGKTPPNWKALLRLLTREGHIEKFRGDKDELLHNLTLDGRREKTPEDEEEAYVEAWGIFVEVVEEKAEYQREVAESVGGGTRTAPHQEENAVPVAVGEQDRRAAVLCAELLAQDAAKDPVVAAFRERELGGGTLTPDAAEDYLQEYERRRSPEEHFHYFELPRSMPHQLLSDEPEREATLGDVAAYLAWRWPWDYGLAAWFVLTGDSPAVQPVNLEVERDNTFTIRLHPWTTKESLSAAHDAMFTPWKGSTYPPKSEALDLLELVLEHTDAAGRRSKTWKELQELWNERHPARKRKTSSAVRRAYYEAREKLAPRRL